MKNTFYGTTAADTTFQPHNKKTERDGRRRTGAAKTKHAEHTHTHTQTPGVFPDPRQWRAVVAEAPPRKARPLPAASS